MVAGKKSSSVGSGGSASFLQSFGVYFPSPPRLRMELLEHKILKETIAIVSFLEKEIAFKDKDLVKLSLKIDGLKAENERFEALPLNKKNIMDQATFLAAETKKQKRNLQKRNQENRKIELKVFLDKILNGEALGEICVDDLKDLIEILEKRMDMFEERLKPFRGSTSGTKDENGFIKEEMGTNSMAVEASNEAKEHLNLPDLNEPPPEE
ncbi:hypothetical protein QJS10_CPA03g02179 [Acorus calamus]|uniref:Uncharacterized protein n=1 Tax=Acorus calamus TaxID=4465 RepID=A0AAV9F2E8_ACOCL|nr:hypothetical protein QJS10_CPA03g02179 [Acorus calamus]